MPKLKTRLPAEKLSVFAVQWRGAGQALPSARLPVLGQYVAASAVGALVQASHALARGKQECTELRATMVQSHA